MYVVTKINTLKNIKNIPESNERYLKNNFLSLSPDSKGKKYFGYVLKSVRNKICEEFNWKEKSICLA